MSCYFLLMLIVSSENGGFCCYVVSASSSPSNAHHVVQMTSSNKRHLSATGRTSTDLQSRVDDERSSWTSEGVLTASTVTGTSLTSSLIYTDTISDHTHLTGYSMLHRMSNRIIINNSVLGGRINGRKKSVDCLRGLRFQHSRMTFIRAKASIFAVS